MRVFSEVKNVSFSQIHFSSRNVAAYLNCRNGAVCVSVWLKVLERLLEGCSSFPVDAGRSSP